MTSPPEPFIETSASGAMLQWTQYAFARKAAHIRFADLEPQVVRAGAVVERRVLETENNAVQFGWTWGSWTSVSVHAGDKTHGPYHSNAAQRNRNRSYLQWDDFGTEVHLTARGDRASAGVLLLRPDYADPTIEVKRGGNTLEVIARASNGRFPALTLHVAAPAGTDFDVSNSARQYTESDGSRRWQLRADEAAFVVVIRPVAGSQVRVLAGGYVRETQLILRRGKDIYGEPRINALANAARRELGRGIRDRSWISLWPRRSSERVAHLLAALQQRFGDAIVNEQTESDVLSRITGLFRLYVLSKLSADIGDAAQAIEALNAVDLATALGRAFPNAKDFISSRNDADERLWAARNHGDKRFANVQATATTGVQSLQRELSVGGDVSRARDLVGHLRAEVPEVPVLNRIIGDLVTYISDNSCTPESAIAELRAIADRVDAEYRVRDVDPDAPAPITKRRHDDWLERCARRAKWRAMLHHVLVVCETGAKQSQDPVPDAATLSSMLENLQVPSVQSGMPASDTGADLHLEAEGLLNTIGDESDPRLIAVVTEHLGTKIRDVASTWIHAHSVIARASGLRDQFAWLSSRIQWESGAVAVRYRAACQFLFLAASIEARAKPVESEPHAAWLATPNAAESHHVWDECAKLTHDLEGVSCVAPLKLPPLRRPYDEMDAETALAAWGQDLAGALAARTHLLSARVSAMTVVGPLLPALEARTIAILGGLEDPSPRDYLELFVRLADERLRAMLRTEGQMHE